MIRRWAGGLARAARRRLADPGLGSLTGAARAAIVLPAVFAFANKVIQDPQVATFAAFGSFAMLVMVDFAGPWRTRLAAYLSLAVAGAVFIVLGTLCSQNPWLAAAVMAAVGLVRVEDVATGFAVSLGVGLLFWPRGAAALLRENLAAAYARNADYLAATARQLLHGGGPGQAHGAGLAALTASHRLDDSFRQYLAECSTLRNAGNLGALVAGAARLQRAAQSLAALSRLTSAGAPPQCAHVLDAEIQALRSWYITFADTLANATQPPPPHTRDTEGRGLLYRCVRTTLGGGHAAPGSDVARKAIVLLWASQHLDNLWRLEGHLARQAAGT